MHLRDRGSRHRLRLDGFERLRQTHPELVCQDFLDLGIAERRDVVLQPRERLGVHGRDDVGTRREELRELDVRRAELLDIARQLARFRNPRLVLVRLLRQELVQAGARHQVAPPVLEQQQREVLVALEMLGPQREVHPERYSNLQAGLNQGQTTFFFSGTLPLGGVMSI